MLSHAAHAPRQRLTQACRVPPYPPATADAPGRPDGLRGVEHPASHAGTLDFFPPSTAPYKLFPTATHPAIVRSTTAKIGIPQILWHNNYHTNLILPDRQHPDRQSAPISRLHKLASSSKCRERILRSGLIHYTVTGRSLTSGTRPAMSPITATRSVPARHFMGRRLRPSRREWLP